MNANIQWLGDGDVGQRLPQCPIGYAWNGSQCVLAFTPIAVPLCAAGQVFDPVQNKCVYRLPQCPLGQFWDGTKCVMQGPALKAAPVYYAKVINGGVTLREARTGQSRVNQARKMALDARRYIAVATGQFSILPYSPCENTANGVTTCIIDVTGLPQSSIDAIMATLWPGISVPPVPQPYLSGPTTGQLGNPDAGVSLSIGVGGLLLFGLAAYGVWRLARG